MANMEGPFLLPLAERFSSDALQRLENVILAGDGSRGVLDHSPHPDLTLVTVVPALNEEETIGTALSCLAAQDLPAERFEVVVVDNGSRDRTSDIVLEFAGASPVPVHLVREASRGCLSAIQRGMDVACARLAQVRGLGQGLIATIDADDRVGPDWAATLVATVVSSRADMVRGRAQTVTALPPDVDRLVKALCDVENRVNAYAELARLRVDEALEGSAARSYPRWMPRITGPNFAITRAAYVAAGGLDPRPPGDQASHLANALLRSGGAIVLSDDPRLTLLRSRRVSQRNFDQARGYGVGFGMGFGDILACAHDGAAPGRSVDYPDPQWLEAGLQRLLSDLGAGNPATRAAAGAFAAGYLGRPVDPSALCRYGAGPQLPPRLPLLEARALLVEMSRRAGGIDYRAYERCLAAQEHLRQEVLACSGACVDPAPIVRRLLLRMGFPPDDLPARVVEAAAALQGLPGGDRADWFARASCELERIYAEMQTD